MTFEDKGWIRHYLHIRNQYTLQKEFEKLSMLDRVTYDPEQFLYQQLLPTGVLYGHPAVLPLENRSFWRALRIESMSTSDRNKAVILECFLHSALTSQRYSAIQDVVDLADATLEAALLIGKFYQSVYKGINTSYRHWFFVKQRKGLALSEFILENKISPATTINKFWPKFFSSSLTFLDILYFGKWIHQDKSALHAQQVAFAHEEMRFLIFQVIVSAALANDVIEPEERQLFEYYIEAAAFSEKYKSLCYQYLEQPASLEDIRLQKITSQVLRKYLFDLAVLVIYADRLLTCEEQDFLNLLQQKLELDATDAESSLISIESFMITHWQQMVFLQKRERLNLLQEQVLQKLTTAVEKHRDVFQHHVQQQPELCRLLQKVQLEKVTQEERNKIQQGLLEVVRSLPSPLFSAVPKTFFSYTILMQIIPEGSLSIKAKENL